MKNLMEKEIWYHLKSNTSVPLINKIFHLNYSTLLVSFKDLDLLKDITLPKRMSIALLLEDDNDLDELNKTKDPMDMNKIRCFIGKNMAHVEQIKKQFSDIPGGLFLNVNDKKTLDFAVDISSQIEILIIEFKDQTNIPLELILATTQKKNVRIVKKVIEAQDGIGSFFTMEKGSDTVLLSSNSMNDIVELDSAFIRSNLIELPLKEATVTDIRHMGLGDRVCVDTTSELFRDEGMILGSTSQGGLFTCSETHYLPYMKLRPFRVNAGALHLYSWGPENKVQYLSDLQAGDETLIINTSGIARRVTIGRLKIEKRPLLKFEAQIDDILINTFIQDDWHVRMMGANGEILPSSEIKTGDKLLGLLDDPGRHVGIKIDEKINEL